jgi:ATP phosphoribosyltransferase regulatory subunit
MVYLPLGHDRAAAARLRCEGWRTRAQLAEGEDPAALGCAYILTDGGPALLEQHA